MKTKTKTKRYIGFLDDCRVPQEVTVNKRQLKPRNDLADFGPFGYSWGYTGAGPSKLALAIVADALGDDERALASYERFRDEVIARLDRTEAFVLEESRVRAALEMEEA